MTVLPLLAISFLMKVVMVLFFICAVVLVLVVLIQKGKGGGLSGAFGGGAVSGILGTQSKGPLTWMTIVLAGVFLVLAVVMAKFFRPSISDFGAGGSVRQEQSASGQQPSIPPATGGESTDTNSLGD